MIITRVPPVNLSTASDTTIMRRWIAGQTPINLTDWTAEFLILDRCDVLFRTAVTLTGDGYLSAVIPAAEAEKLRCKRGLNHQFNITSPDGYEEIWTGPAFVQRVEA